MSKQSPSQEDMEWILSILSSEMELSLPEMSLPNSPLFQEKQRTTDSGDRSLNSVLEELHAFNSRFKPLSSKTKAKKPTEKQKDLEAEKHAEQVKRLNEEAGHARRLQEEAEKHAAQARRQQEEDMQTILGLLEELEQKLNHQVDFSSHLESENSSLKTQLLHTQKEQEILFQQIGQISHLEPVETMDFVKSSSRLTSLVNLVSNLTAENKGLKSTLAEVQTTCTTREQMWVAARQEWQELLEMEEAWLQNYEEQWDHVCDVPDSAVTLQVHQGHPYSFEGLLKRTQGEEDLVADLRHKLQNIEDKLHDKEEENVLLNAQLNDMKIHTSDLKRSLDTSELRRARIKSQLDKIKETWKIVYG
jgi:chromosome segregation ATPase